MLQLLASLFGSEILQKKSSWLHASNSALLLWKVSKISSHASRGCTGVAKLTRFGTFNAEFDVFELCLACASSFDIY